MKNGFYRSSSWQQWPFLLFEEQTPGAFPRHSVSCPRFGRLAQHADAWGNALFYLGNEALIVGVLRQPHRRKVPFKVEQVQGNT